MKDKRSFYLDSLVHIHLEDLKDIENLSTDELHSRWVDSLIFNADDNERLILDVEFGIKGY
jgi:hypothetical protein